MLCNRTVVMMFAPLRVLILHLSTGLCNLYHLRQRFALALVASCYLLEVR
jgi:hypothetical protein